MRIAAFPKGELAALVVHRTKTVFEWIDDAKVLGVDGLELHTGFLWSDDPGYIGSVADAIAAAGFEMPMMCASPDFTNPDPEVRAREIDDQARFMRHTREIGGPGATARVLSGQGYPEVSVEQGIEWAGDAIRQLIPLAKELGIALAIENHYKASTWTYPEFAQRPEIFLALLDSIPERADFGVQFDPSNAITAGIDPGDLLEKVIDRVITMQASDRFLAPGASLDALRQADGTIGYAPELQHGVIGQGLNDYDRIFGILRDAGYDGWISIEDGVNGMDEMIASADFLKDARDRWFGGSHAVRVRNHELARAAAAEAAATTL